MLFFFYPEYPSNSSQAKNETHDFKKDSLVTFFPGAVKWYIECHGMLSPWVWAWMLKSSYIMY